jgi:hypothetical protein
VPAPEKIAYEAADEDRGAKEPTPFGNTDKAHDQHSDDDYQADGMAGPEACAKFAVGNNGHGVAIIIDGSDYLVKRVTTKRHVGFHGVLAFQRAHSVSRE